MEKIVVNAVTGEQAIVELTSEEIAQANATQTAWEALQSATYIVRQQEARSNAYRNESDPLFFKWQRGEGTEQEWKDKVAEIQARYPYEQLAGIN